MRRYMSLPSWFVWNKTEFYSRACKAVATTWEQQQMETIRRTIVAKLLSFRYCSKVATKSQTDSSLLSCRSIHLLNQLIRIQKLFSQHVFATIHHRFDWVPPSTPAGIFRTWSENQTSWLFIKRHSSACIHDFAESGSWPSRIIPNASDIFTWVACHSLLSNKTSHKASLPQEGDIRYLLFTGPDHRVTVLS